MASSDSGFSDVEMNLYISTYAEPFDRGDEFESRCSEREWWNPEKRHKVIFGDEEIRLPEKDIELKYFRASNLRMYSCKTKANSDEVRYRRSVIRFTVDNGGVAYLYTSAKDKLERAIIRKKVVKAVPPKFPNTLEKHLSSQFQDKESGDAPEYILTDFIRDSMEPNKYWVSGFDKEKAEINLSGQSSGKSKGVQVGAFSRSKSKSEISISGQSSKKEQMKRLSILLVKENKIILDGYYGKFEIPYGTIEHLGKKRTIKIVTGTFKFKIYISQNSPFRDEALEYMRTRVGMSRNEGSEGSNPSEGISPKIRELHSLKEDGIITKEEFEEKKKKLLKEY